MPLTTLVRLAKLRWRIEHDYREMKQALGLAHFEGLSAYERKCIAAYV
jgi:SRSO17 transposase